MEVMHGLHLVNVINVVICPHNSNVLISRATEVLLPNTNHVLGFQIGIKYSLLMHSKKTTQDFFIPRVQTIENIIVDLASPGQY